MHDRANVWRPDVAGARGKVPDASSISPSTTHMGWCPTVEERLGTRYTGSKGARPVPGSEDGRMNDATRDFVIAEWESSLGVDRVALRAGGVHVVSVDLGMNDAMSFLLEDACIVVVPAPEVGAAREILAGVDVATAFTAGMLRRLVGAEARVDGPSVHTYLDLHSFTSVGESAAIEVSGEDSGLLDFLEGNDLADWGESGFPRDPRSADSSTTRFWVLPDDDGATVAAGTLTEWRGLPADVGILTAPARRGRGHARRLVNAMMTAALPGIGVARYRALASNRASLAVARRLGFEECGQNFRARRPHSA